GRTCTGVDDDGLSRESPGVPLYFNFFRAGEGRFSSNQFQAFRLVNGLLAALSKILHDSVLSASNLEYIGRDGAYRDAKVGGSAGKISHPCTGHHRLGGSTAIIDTTPTYRASFDDRSLSSRVSQRDGQRFSALSGSNDDGIIVLLVQISLISML